MYSDEKVFFKPHHAQQKEMTSMVKHKGFFIVKNARGLHTRPSTEIVKLASSFKCDIKLKHQNVDVNAKSLLGILMLAVPKGAKIDIVATGKGAQEAVEALEELAFDNFNIKY